MTSNVQTSMVCTNSLALQWTPATSGTSYTISLTNTTTLVTNSTNISIEGLIDGSNYTISVAATNCAGSSNSSSVSVQTCDWYVYVCIYLCVCVGGGGGQGTNQVSFSLFVVPCAPVSVTVTTILYQNNSVYDVELFWTHRR